MSKTKEELTQEVETLLQNLREGLVLHAGDVELVEADPETGVVTVRLLGMCVGCPWSDLTLKGAIEETLTHAIPEIKKVVNVE